MSSKRGARHCFSRLHSHIQRHAKKMHRSIKHHSQNIHRHIVDHFHQRKHIEYEYLPRWKLKMLHFNHDNMHWLELIIEKLIPILVLLLFFIIIAELSSYMNAGLDYLFHWTSHSLTLMAEFAHANEHDIKLVDKVIISFFVVELYFNFFKKATWKSFIRSYFLDIIAILPLGWITDLAKSEIVTAQGATHVAVDTQRIASRSAKIAKILKILSRIPRVIRLYRIYYWFTPDRIPKHINTKLAPMHK